MLLSGEINNSKTERYMLDFILAVNPAGVDVFLGELRKRAKDERKREIETFWRPGLTGCLQPGRMRRGRAF